MTNLIYLLYKNVLYLVDKNNGIKAYKWNNNLNDLIKGIYKTSKKPVSLIISSNISFNIALFMEKSTKVTDEYIKSNIITQVPVDKASVLYKYEELEPEDDYKIVQIEIYSESLLNDKNKETIKEKDPVYKQAAIQNMHCFSNILKSYLPKSKIGKILIYEIGDMYEILVLKESAVIYSETVERNKDMSNIIDQKIIFLYNKFLNGENFEIYINTKQLEDIIKHINTMGKGTLKPYQNTVVDCYTAFQKSSKHIKSNFKENETKFTNVIVDNKKIKFKFLKNKSLVILIGVFIALLIILGLLLLFSVF
jgi:hypothetical protein